MEGRGGKTTGGDRGKERGEEEWEREGKSGKLVGIARWLLGGG